MGIYSGATVQTTAPYIVNVTPYTVYVGAAVNYTIVSVKLTVGNQTMNRSGEGAISITPNRIGEQSVKVFVSAKRNNQNYAEEYSLDPITVKNPYLTLKEYEVSRTDTTGKSLDDGTNACIKLTIDYPQITGNYLSQPIVKVDGTTTNNVTWYTAWTPTGGFSSAVNWTNYAPAPPVTIYGKATDTFLDSLSYEIGITPISTLGHASERTIILAQTFRLLSARSGGKGLGIGMKPTSDALWLNMDMEVYQKMDIHYNLDSTVHPDNPDYELYEVLNALGISSRVKDILAYVAKATKVDYVVSQGTSGIWAYRKWNSGRAELWATDSVSSLAITTAKGSLYSSAQRQVNLPFTVYDGVGSVSIGSTVTSTYYPWAGNVRVYEGSIRYYAECTASVTLNADDISYIVTGRWK